MTRRKVKRKIIELGTIREVVCEDIGVDSLEDAARNREMVAKKDKVIGYVEVEEAEELPEDFGIGTPPSVGRRKK
ncbi:MAG: hypothetical protein ACXABY_05160 [Candidatus Thorarchaeota archaeon]|jgi:hypothetical protein